MTEADDAYVYDEETSEWISAADAAAKKTAAAGAGAVEVRDAVGNLLADGDAVTLIKDLGLTGDAQEIDCRYEGIKGLVLRAEFVKKR